MENSDADSYLVIVKNHVTAEAPGLSNVIPGLT